MKKLSLIWIAALLLVLTSFTNASDAETTSLSVRMGNIRSSEGQIYVFLYNYENQYPKHPFHHYKVSKANVKDGYLKFTIPDLSHGEYVISLIDDENMNDDLDRTFGVPTEGFAFSNNKSVSLSGLPAYGELKFKVDEGNSKVNLFIRYLF